MKPVLTISSTQEWQTTHPEAVFCLLELYGQDNVSPITSVTTHVLYVAYAPAGVPADTVESQLQRIEENVRLFCPAAIVEGRQLFCA